MGGNDNLFWRIFFSVNASDKIIPRRIKTTIYFYLIIKIGIRILLLVNMNGKVIPILVNASGKVVIPRMIKTTIFCLFAYKD